MTLKFAAGLVLLASIAATASAQQAPPAPPPAASSPDVNLTPRRLVFTQADRGVKEITVFNRSSEAKTYNIVILDQVMMEDGSLVDTQEAPAEAKQRLKSAASWIRYSPRQVVLGPNESQTVRIQARKPADLPAGEYRAHFSVVAVPPQDSGFDIAAAATGEAPDQFNIKLTPVYGIMIPIIVRTADLPAQAGISDVRLLQQAGRKAVQFSVTRTGDRSLYGGLEVFLVGKGGPRKIAAIRGVGVYGELDQRTVTLPIEGDGAQVAPGSRVRIVYTDDELKPGTLLAETEATLS